jgi:hypothetical protein
MSKTLTPWFPPDVKPARDGVYKVRILTIYPEDERYSRWWRGKWRFTADTKEDARIETAPSYDCYSSYFKGWRGLAKEPT